MKISSTHTFADTVRLGAALGAMQRALDTLTTADSIERAREILRDALNRDKKARRGSEDVIADLGVEDSFPDCETCDDEGYHWEDTADGPAWVVCRDCNREEPQ